MHSRWTCARTEVPARLIFESDFRPVHRCPRAGGRTKKADESNRDAACQRGICPAIPYRCNTKDIPAFFPEVLYKGAPVRASSREAQPIQAQRTSMREDGADLRLVRRACSRHHLDQIRPHGLVGQGFEAKERRTRAADLIGGI